MAYISLSLPSSAALASSPNIEQWLHQGISAAKAGNLQQARFQLLDVVEQDQTNETAWYWLYQVFDRVDDKRTCLENLILINPKNMWAKEELLNLLEISAPFQPIPQMAGRPVAPPRTNKKSGQTKTQPGVARTATLKLVTAFWVGISLMFLGGGIISTGQWLAASLMAPKSPTPLPFLDLTVGVVFIIAGVLGICVATALYYQSVIGFYGSLLMGLGLLLAGPTFSLIINPPNYVAMTCTGGISGMIVLLTLASQSGVKSFS